MKRFLYTLIKPTVIVVCAVSLCIGGIYAYLYAAIHVDLAKLIDCPNLIIQDRHGRDLRFYPDDLEERHLWITMNEVPQHLIQAFLAADEGNHDKAVAA